MVQRSPILARLEQKGALCPLCCQAVHQLADCSITTSQPSQEHLLQLVVNMDDCDRGARHCLDLQTGASIEYRAQWQRGGSDQNSE